MSDVEDSVQVEFNISPLDKLDKEVAKLKQNILRIKNIILKIEEDASEDKVS